MNINMVAMDPCSEWGAEEAITVSPTHTLESVHYNPWKIRKDWLKISVLSHELQSIYT